MKTILFTTLLLSAITLKAQNKWLPIHSEEYLKGNKQATGILDTTKVLMLVQVCDSCPEVIVRGFSVDERWRNGSSFNICYLDINHKVFPYVNIEAKRRDE